MKKCIDDIGTSVQYFAIPYMKSKLSGRQVIWIWVTTGPKSLLLEMGKVNSFSTTTRAGLRSWRTAQALEVRTGRGCQVELNGGGGDI